MTQAQIYRKADPGTDTADADADGQAASSDKAARLSSLYVKPFFFAFFF